MGPNCGEEREWCGLGGVEGVSSGGAVMAVSVVVAGVAVNKNTWGKGGPKDYTI